MDNLKPQQKLGEYTLLRKLAEGGMAEIYLATRGGASGFSKNCVIKRVRDEHRGDKNFVAMFEHEARLAANLEHSNIVQIFDFQRTDDGELYLAMQYVDGCSLEQLRRRLPHGVIPPFLAARIARDVAKALAYAYDFPGPDGQPLRLVHRDISPHNILVSRLGEVKLTDFGIAKPAATKTQGNGFKGKVAYAAPEQARSKDVDGRTDLFSLGVVLCELCTGERPFTARDELDLLVTLMRGDLRFEKAKLPPNLPEALGLLLEKALRAEPAERFQTAAEMAQALDEIVRSAPNAVDTDLARFVAERLGPVVPEPVEVPQIPEGAFDATVASPVREPTAITPAPAPRGSTAVHISSEPELAQTLRFKSSPAMPALDVGAEKKKSSANLPALDPSAQPAQGVVVAPDIAQPTPSPTARTEPEDSSEFETVEASLEAARRGSGKGKLAWFALLLIPVGLGVTGLLAYRRTRVQQTPATSTVVVVHPEEESPKPVEPPKKPAQVAPVEVKPVEAKPAVAQPSPTPPPAHPEPATKPNEVAPKPAKVAAAPRIEAQPAPTAAGATGTLKLLTEPYAEVYDGSDLLSTDGTRTVDLPAGHHVLRYHWAGGNYLKKILVPRGGSICLHAHFLPSSKPSFTPCK